MEITPPNVTQICFPLQPMEIYIDDEEKLTLHGLVQVLNLFEFNNV